MTFLKNSGESCYVSQASYPPQFASFTVFAFGRGLRLAVLVMVLGMSGRMVGAADFLYVSLDDNTVARFDISLLNPADISASKIIIANSLSNPRGLAFDSFGNLFVANDGDNSISKITPSGIKSQFASLSRPNSMAFDSIGDLYVGNDGSNTISKITANGVVSTFVSSSLLANPRGIVFDNVGNLMVANGALNTICKITPSGSISNFVTSGVDTMIGLTIDHSGYLYATNFIANTITKIDPTGNSNNFTIGLNRPTGVAFNSSNQLFVANNGNNTISRIDSNGNILISFSTGAAKPLLLAFQPVPEPSTYALGLIAAGAMAWVGRRRKGCRNQA